MTNLVVVHTDDSGRLLGPYGHDVPTPALDEFADEALTFRNAHCAGPTCSPSRAAVTTGQWPHSAGMLGLAHRGFSLSDPDRHLAGYLSERGYQSVLAGQQHETGEGDGAARHVLGYDRVIAGDPATVDLPFDHEKTRRDLANADAVAAWLRERDREVPFYLSVGLHNTHQPMPLDQALVDPDRVRVPEPLPDAPEVREEVAGFHALAGYVDDCVRTILDALREAGAYDDTVVVFTTDHGPPFPFMKCSLFEGGTGIALLVRTPEGERAGEVEDALVSNVDLFPTVCDCLGVERPPWLQGESLAPLLRGDADSVRDELFSEVTYHAAYEPKRCVRTDRYLYVRRFDEECPRWIPANVDHGPTKEYLVERGLLDRDRPQAALYDCALDPGERENLIDDPAYAAVREALSSRLRAWMERTDDPLLEGPVSKPEGARADSRDALHPNGGPWEPEDAR